MLAFLFPLDSLGSFCKIEIECSSVIDNATCSHENQCVCEIGYKQMNEMECQPCEYRTYYYPIIMESFICNVIFISID